MIDSGIYTKSTVVNLGEIDTQQFSLSSSSATVNKSTMYHLVNSHIYQIFNDPKIDVVLKEKFVQQFGFKLGYNIAQEECLGYAKHCIAKPDGKKQKHDNKQFLGQMKILHGKIWNILIGNKGKLFAINNESNKGPYYKIEDKQFTLGKSYKKPVNQGEKFFRKLLLQFCSGFMKGALQKFDLSGQIFCGEGTEGAVFAQFKNLYRKNITSTYNQYLQELSKVVPPS